MRRCLLAAMLTMLPAVAAAQYEAAPPDSTALIPPTDAPFVPPGLMFQSRKTLFNVLDADGDGRIVKAELRRAGAALRTLDGDGDGAITLRESFGGPSTAMLADMSSQGVLTANDQNRDGLLSADEVPPKIMRFLKGADKNRDKAIDREELAAAIERAGPQFYGLSTALLPGAAKMQAASRAQQLMRNDRNGDGKLSPEEVPEQALAMLRGGDANRDGQIDEAELQAICKRTTECFGERVAVSGEGVKGDGHGSRQQRLESK